MVKFSELYDKHYKKALIIPALLLLFSIGYLVYFYVNTGDLMYRDVSLTGGTSVTLFGNYSSDEVLNALSSSYPDISVSTISDSVGRISGVVILIAKETPEDITKTIQEKMGIELTNENSSIEFTGASLGSGFYSQLAKALVFAFILMALVVFFVFGENKKLKVYAAIITAIAARLTFPISNLLGILIFVSVLGLCIYGLILFKSKKEAIYLGILFLIFVALFFFPVYIFIVPAIIALLIIFFLYSIQSVSIIISAFSNIVSSLALVNLLGIKISSAGIIAFLMLVGYAVDDNILLTSKVMRRKGSVNRAIFDAFKTGFMMIATSFMAIGIALFFLYRFESILNQIFLIIMFGLSFDLINTWIGNAGIIKWFVERKK